MFKVGVHVMTVSSERVGREIVRGIERKTNTLYTPLFWTLIMLVIRAIPQSLFKRLSL